MPESMVVMVTEKELLGTSPQPRARHGSHRRSPPKERPSLFDPPAHRDRRRAKGAAQSSADAAAVAEVCVICAALVSDATCGGMRRSTLASGADGCAVAGGVFLVAATTMTTVSAAGHSRAIFRETVGVRYGCFVASTVRIELRTQHG